jgi:pimeloyl-ACP methyl ester carboxylesterase
MLLLWGDQDIVSPFEPWKNSIINYPKIQLQVLENSGHSPMLEKPKEFWHSIEGFLKTKLVHNIS